MTTKTDELDSQEFYELCQAYRHEPLGAEECVKRFEAIKQFARRLLSWQRERAEPVNLELLDEAQDHCRQCGLDFVPIDFAKSREHILEGQRLRIKADSETINSMREQLSAAPPPAPEPDAQGMVMAPEKMKLPCTCYTPPNYDGCECGNYDDAHYQGVAQGWNDCIDALRGKGGA